MKNKFKVLITLALSTLFVTSCGGGGGAPAASSSASQIETSEHSHSHETSEHSHETSEHSHDTSEVTSEETSKAIETSEESSVSDVSSESIIETSSYIETSEAISESSEESSVSSVHIHTPGAPVTENYVGPTCTEPGSYDEVVYCTECGEELSRQTHSIEPKGHNPDAPTYENYVSATCTEPGSYDEVVYCIECGEELSRTTEVIYATGHTEAAPVTENYLPATCTEPGSYDEVVYCDECGEEVSRTHYDLEPLGHIDGAPVTENYVGPTCTEPGSYDEVTYCTVCGEEISRINKTVPATGHTPGDPVIENLVESTCAIQGSYDEVTYCTVCGEEISRVNHLLPLDEHNYVATVTPPTYEAAGYTTYKCSVCGDEYTVEGDPKLEHTYATAWSVDEAKGTHYHACLDEGYTDLRGSEAPHDFDIIYVDKEPTASEDGWGHHVCKVCGYQEGVKLDALGTVDKIRFDVYEDLGYVVAFAKNEDISGEVVVPNTYQGLPVKKIGYFSNCPKMTSFKATGSNLIAYTSGSTSLFKDDTALVNVELSDNLTSIVYSMFENCTALETFTCPAKCTRIDSRAFYQCSRLYQFTLGEKVTSIGDEAFWMCSNLYEIINLSSLNLTTYSPDYGYISFYAGHICAHAGDTALRREGDWLIYDVSPRKYVVKYFGSATHVVVPNGYTNFLGYSIAGNQIVSITMPSTTRGFDSDFYKDAPNLVEIINLSSISSDRFSFATIYKTGGNSSVTVNENNDIIASNRGNIIYCGNTASTSLVVEESCNQIKSFSSRNDITSFDFAGKDVTIPSSAFSNCSNLASVSGTQGLSRLPDGLFTAVSKIKSIRLGSALTYIGKNLFTAGSVVIYYDGTASEWEAVEKDSQWNYWHSVTKVICDGETINL